MTTYTTFQAVAAPQTQATSVAASAYLPRSPLTPLPFFVPVLLSGISAIGGGIPALMDMSMLLLTFLCATLFANELIRFPRRFGVGGIVVFSGVLIWFSSDYLETWYGLDWVKDTGNIDLEVVARSVFLHSVFVLMMTCGLFLPFGRWLEKPFFWFKEPPSGNLYFMLVLLLTGIGLFPYFIWSVDPWYVAIWRDINGQRYAGARWELQGPGGNINVAGNWGQYVALMMKAGQFSGQLAIFYALLVARSGIGKTLGWLVWFFWVIYAFGSNTRGHVVAMFIPAAALVYLKNQALAAMVFQRISKRAYLWSMFLGLFMLFIIQTQIALRGTTLLEGDFSKISLQRIHGNAMFSATLPGLAIVPDEKPFYFDSVPGEKLVRPIPQTVFNFCIGPIPRALWRNKPVDKVGLWFNTVITGRASGIKRANFTPGIVAWWYLRYGISGVVQGGMLFGFLLIVTERVIQRAEGKTITILLAMVFAVWLFRCFRIWNYINLYPFMIAALGLWIMIQLAHMMNVRRAG